MLSLLHLADACPYGPEACAAMSKDPIQGDGATEQPTDLGVGSVRRAARHHRPRGARRVLAREGPVGAGETCGRWARGIVDKSSCTVLLKSVCIRNHAQMISAEGGEELPNGREVKSTDKEGKLSKTFS